MEINRFTDNNLKLLVLIYKKGFVTSGSQSIYGGLGFYGAKMFLFKKGLIKNDGVNDKKQYIWVLTEKGKKFIKLFDELERLLSEEVTEDTEASHRGK